MASQNTPVIQFAFNGGTTNNPGGGLLTTLPGDAQIVDGPGQFGHETLPKAVKLRAKSIAVDMSNVAIPDTTRFRARVYFKLDQAFNNQSPQQTLVESRRLPFSIRLQGQPDSAVKVVCSVTTAAAGTRTTQATSVADYDVIPGTWHGMDLIYEIDTLGVLMNGRVMSCYGFGANGTVNLNTAEKFLYIGGDSNTASFKGSIAWVYLEYGLNGQFEDLVTQHRTTAQWYMTTAVENHRKKVDIGNPTEPARYSEPATTWIQYYDSGAVLYSPATSSAYVIFGLIWSRYRLLDAGTKGLLGYLASDEMISRQEAGRKSLFQGGGIYWSPSTPATEVYGPIYAFYETTGEASAWGFPARAMETFNGGQKQLFQGGVIYHKTDAAAAQGIKGEILQLYNSTGGFERWGFPITPEERLQNVRPFFNNPGSPSFDRYVVKQDFERGSAYIAEGAGAHFIYGHIRDDWLAKGGPHSSLGLPNTEEMDIPGAPGARMSGFDYGVITWFGARDLMYTVTPFKFFLGVIRTQENEGAFGGRNNIYANTSLRLENNIILSKRFPGSGEFPAGNDAVVNEKLPTLISPKPFETYSFVIDVWDEDSGFLGSDDKLGTWSKVLNAANAWGFKDNMGLLNSGSFDKILDISAACQPEVDIKSLSQTDKFWGITNEHVDRVDYATYAEAFRDVDSDPEGWDIFDWTDKIFFELAVKGCAKKGLCFGLTFEAINAQIGSSIFSQPISRFNRDAIRHVITVKHCYQLGAASCFSFVGGYLSGMWSDPIKVYNLAKEQFEYGNPPCISISQGRDFSGAPHAVLPYGFPPISQDPQNPTGKILIQDSQVSGGGYRELTVNFRANSFKYQSAVQQYAGGTEEGGRFYFTPWSAVSTRPRTALAEVTFFLVTGILIILGDDSESVSVKGRDNEDLDAHGAEATAKLKSGTPANNYFVKHPVRAGTPDHGKLLVTRGHQGQTLPPAPVLNAEQRRILSYPGVPPIYFESQIPTRVPKTWFSHEAQGTVANGTHSHFVKAGSSHVYVSCPINAGEKTTLQGRDLQTSIAEVSWQFTSPKPQAEFTVMHRNGHSRNGIMMKFDLALPNAGTLVANTRPGLTAVVFNPGAIKPTKAVLNITVAKDGKASTTAYDLIKLSGAQHTALNFAVRIKYTPGTMGDKVGIGFMTLGANILWSNSSVAGQVVVSNADMPEFPPRTVPH
jgi:hypothetical protein